MSAQGAAVMPASAFACDRQPVEHAVRTNFACASSRDELARAPRIVVSTLADRPRALIGHARGRSEPGAGGGGSVTRVDRATADGVRELEPKLPPNYQGGLWFLTPM
ncbi:hypothetical protein [Sinorhizobium americanum]|uniref:Uncharacterized protein n=2 Tax=Sinorhizobium TaxID=28105 RepID=A0A2S3YTM9_9HYPH|nr:hypothetical protein [Sinorhizobium americanum]PDT38050.1 hypothetical protein CO656_23455 [Sinorhizobium sp. FG01]POH34994.1 hypothetical protein ATY31_04355 [Sinorhizobium americanum]